tara:strand:+ start:182 stop:424 length:243 start_codon:yes stop_codon:yes gene_type:complete
MALVKFPDSFLRITGGIDQLELEVKTVRDLNAKLLSRWPQLSEDLDNSALSIDGYIFQEALLEPLNEDSEVFFLPKIEGG